MLSCATQRRAALSSAAAARERKMSNDTPLFAIIIGLAALTAYLIATRPVITEEQRKSMEEDWWG